MRQVLKLFLCLALLSPSLLGFATETQALHSSGGNSALFADAAMLYETDKLPLINREIPEHAIEWSSIQPALLAGKNNKAAACPSKVVYLTFDDGPSKYTAEVLDVLKREGITATFFVLGSGVEKYPDVVKRIAEEGHSLGNHTYDHKYDVLYGSFDSFAAQIIATEEAIFNASGIRTSLVRAPGGTYLNFDQGYFDSLAAAGYMVHDWNVDSGDSKRRGVPADEIVTTIKGSKLHDKLNVLLHDGSGHGESLKALPEIIAYYKNLGYSFLPLTEQDKPMQFKLASKPKWSRGAVTEAQTERLVEYASSARSGTENPIASTAVFSSQQMDTSALACDAQKAGANEEAGPAAAGSAANTSSSAAIPASSSIAKPTTVSASVPAASEELATVGWSLKAGQESTLVKPYLTIFRGEEALTLAPHEYVLIDGSIYLPLRKLMTWIGGEVRHDPNKGLLESHLNGKSLQWNVGPPAGIRSDGDLQIPLRATLKHFGIEIGDYVYNDKQRAVWINS